MSKQGACGKMRTALLALVVAAAACGGNVVVDSTRDAGAMGNGGVSGAGVGGATGVGAASGVGGAAPGDASAPPPPDAAACDDPAICSRIVTHTGCFSATTVGWFCDFLATPCAPMPPDCGSIGAVLGMSATEASCGNGTSMCRVDWTGTVDASLLGLLCKAHAATGVPLDCISD